MKLSKAQALALKRLAEVESALVLGSWENALIAAARLAALCANRVLSADRRK
jgi:hypothetical protein